MSEQVGKVLRAEGWGTPPGWWDAEDDFFIPKAYRVSGKNLYEVMDKIMKHYKLKINFYTWDKTVKVVSLQNR